VKKRLEKLTNYPNIYQIKIWDDASGSWAEAAQGMRFRVFYYQTRPDGTKKRMGKYFDSLDQAKAFYLRNRFEKPEPKMPETKRDSKDAGSGMLFGELVELWLKVWLPNKNFSTQIRYKSYLQHFTLFWNLPVEKIEPSAIDRWIVEIKKPEYLERGHTTRCDYKHEFSVLRGILNFYASRFNRNYRLPFLKDHKAMLKVREKAKLSKDLTVEEFKCFSQALKQVCTEHDCEPIYYLAMMQYATYCRVQEASALHYEDFDLSRNRLTINKKVQWPRAKGLTTQIVSGSKANGGKEIPLPALAARIFKEWVMKSGIRSGPLFLLDGNIPEYRQIEYRYTQALKRMGSRFSATHILRHASLTEYYELSKDLLMTAAMAGQRDIRSTMKYTKVRDDRVIQMQKQMDERPAGLLESK